MGDSDEDFETPDFESPTSRQRRGKFRNEREDANKRSGASFKQTDRSASESRNSFNRNQFQQQGKISSDYGNHRRSGNRSPRNNRRAYSPRRSDGYNTINQINSPPMRSSQYGSRYDPHDNNIYNKRPLSPPVNGNQHFKNSHFMPGFNSGQPIMSPQYYNDNRSPFAHQQMPYRSYNDSNRSRSPEHPSFFLDQAQKKQRRDWSGFNDMPVTSYIEHDNRISPEYSPDKFYGDYNPYPNRPLSNSLSMPYNSSYNQQFDSGLYNSNWNQPIRTFAAGNQGFNQNNGYNNMYNNEPQMGPMNNMGFMPQMNPIMTNQNSNFSNNNNTNNNNNNRSNQGNNDGIGQTQPPMLSFKQFLNNLNESDPTSSSLSPEEITNKYSDYKNNFRCIQIDSFFANHKQEEWFKQRYHPEVAGKRKDEQRTAVLRRLGIFNDLLKRFNTEARQLSLDMSEPMAEKYLLKFIDACMIKLEEGTDEDLKILEKIYENDQDDEKTQRDKVPGEEGGSEYKNKPKKENPTIIPIPQKVQSIFFKHLPVNVTRQDLEQIGSKYEGFKRASISEPAPERRFQRRGWLTFDSTVNIKEICSKINGIKLQDMILYPTINRELDQKIKCIIGLTNHKQIVRNDVKIIAKIVDTMDKRWGLWQYSGTYSNNKLKDEDFQTDSDKRKLKKAEETSVKIETETKCLLETVDSAEENPFVKSAKDYLRELSEEVVKTEEAAKSPASKAPSTFKLEVDRRAACILDNLILYLRMVHSIDYYNSTEYQQEDWMPNRIGILHVRGSIANKSSASSNTVNIFNGVNINYFDPLALKKIQVEEWLRLFEQHIKLYHEYRAEIDADLAKRLGLKDLAEEVNKFISVNTKKLEKDVWLCPIGGKKFKGPEYVKKYIETKCRDKLLEVRSDVEYFNRFVYDPKRPYLPEHPMTRNIGQQQQQQQQPNNNNNGSNLQMNQSKGNSYNNPQNMMNPNSGGGYPMLDSPFSNYNQGFLNSTYQHEGFGFGSQYPMMRGTYPNSQEFMSNSSQQVPVQSYMNNKPFRR